jgi:hypothetical protein
MPLYKTLTWAEVSKFYKESLADSPLSPAMSKFVGFIEESPYANWLFPKTSVVTLVISSVQDFDWDDNKLRVDFDPDKNEFIFLYEPKLDNMKVWEQRCEAKDVIEVFERIILEQLRWFTIKGEN